METTSSADSNIAEVTEGGGGGGEMPHLIKKNQKAAEKYPIVSDICGCEHKGS